MGAPAVLTWQDDNGGTVARFYLHWASPCYQLPYLARWAHETEQAGHAFTPLGYLEAAFTRDDLDMPREPIGSDNVGADYRYTLQQRRKTTGGYGVVLAVTVQERQRLDPLDGREYSIADRWVTVHDTATLADLYLAAATEARAMAARARELIDRDGPGVRLFPDPDETDQAADEFAGWADAAMAPVGAGQ